MRATPDPAAAEVIAETIPFQDREFSASMPPPGFVVDREVGLLMHQSIQGRLIYRPKGGTYGIPATIKTPRGDYLMMFPEGPHYKNQKYEKVNRMVAFRSKDQGRTWELLPKRRHGGWYVRGFNRLDEGRPIDLGGGNVFLMTRSAEGHLWGLWSDDDGKTWTKPAPTPLVNPDAPPMLYKLSDDKTLVDGTTIHLFVPHRWARVLQLTFKESDLTRFPTKAELLRR